MLSFKTEAFKVTIDNIKENISNMEKDVMSTLKDFIKEMPEYKNQGITPGTPEDDDFWKNITVQPKDELSIDDLLEYLSKNYNEKAMDETARNSLLTQIESIREGTIEVIKQNAKDLIAEQKQIAEQNREIIQEEERQYQKLVEDIEQLENEKIELEAATASLKDEELKENEAKKTANKEKLARLNQRKARLESDPNNSIAKHKFDQAQFEKEISNNEKELRVLLKKNSISIENEQVTPDGQQQVTPNEQQVIQSNGQQLPAVVNNNEIKSMSAKQKLKALRNAPNKKEILDDMGYGDIAEMIQELGPLSRRKLRIILNNRAEEYGINPEKLEKEDLTEILESADRIEDFMEQLGNRTPQDIRAFEHAYQKTKYGCLLYDAKRGFIRRMLKEHFSRTDEGINHTKSLLTSWHDSKSKRKTAGDNFRNSIRVKLGKPKLNEIHEPARPVEKTR